jgi:general secretion pathway protein C
MKAKIGTILMHVVGAALAGAIAAFWVLRLIAHPTPPAPPPLAQAVVREADPALAGRMFGDVGARQAAPTLNVEVSGVFASGKASSAVVTIDGKPARAVLLGQEVAPGVTLAEVRPDGILLEREGERTSYSVPPLEIATASEPVNTFRREGAVLTAPSMDTPPTARAPTPGAMPGQAMMPRRPMPPAPPPPPSQSDN